MVEYERKKSIREDVALGVVDGFNLLLQDTKVVDEFWERGYTQLVKHGANNANQWVGRRILTWLITTVTIAGMIWLVKSGTLK